MITMVRLDGEHREGHTGAKRPEKTCLRWQWTRITCSLGFVFIFAAIISRIVMPMYVEYKIFINMPWENGSESFEAWKSPPVTPTMALYVFNFTNTEAFQAGLEKPNFVEIGPYLYRQKMVKKNMSFSEDGEELTYSVYREFYYEPHLSADGLDAYQDYVIVPNIPIFGLVKAMAKASSTEKQITKSLLQSYASVGIDTGPFIRVSVHELFWGYPSILLSLKRLQENPNCNSQDEEDFFSMFNEVEEDKGVNCDIVQGNLVPFGIFSMRNATILDPRTVKTGKSSPLTKGHMVAWHGKTMLNYWSSEECNQVRGRDPSGLPLVINDKDVINLFIGQICRPLPFKFEKSLTVESEFPAMRFVPQESSFSAPEQVPENACYCLQEPCLPSGLLDIGGCQPGSPVYMSWPHFLHADPRIRRLIQGMAPDEEKHSFFMDVMPKYGVALRALARLQMNVIAEKNDGFGWFNNIQNEKVYLPVMWLEEGIIGPSQAIKDKVKYIYSLPDMVANLQTLGLFVLGLVLLIPEIILWSRNCFADLR